MKRCPATALKNQGLKQPIFVSVPSKQAAFEKAGMLPVSHTGTNQPPTYYKTQSANIYVQ